MKVAAKDVLSIEFQLKIKTDKLVKLLQRKKMCVKKVRKKFSLARVAFSTLFITNKFYPFAANFVDWQTIILNWIQNNHNYLSL